MAPADFVARPQSAVATQIVYLTCVSSFPAALMVV
jgi:hypothetical protein